MQQWQLEKWKALTPRRLVKEKIQQDFGGWQSVWGNKGERAVKIASGVCCESLADSDRESEKEKRWLVLLWIDSGINTSKTNNLLVQDRTVECQVGEDWTEDIGLSTTAYDSSWNHPKW